MSVVDTVAIGGLSAMSRIRHNRHDWAWIYATANYEYQQCQHPSCGKIRRVNTRTGEVKILTKDEIKRLWSRMP